MIENIDLIMSQKDAALVLICYILCVACCGYGLYLILHEGSILGVICMLIGLPLVVMSMAIMDRCEEKRQVQLMLEEGAGVYLDGQKVDPDTIILEDYTITIKGENIILSD